MQERSNFYIDFIDDIKLLSLIERDGSDIGHVREIIAKSFEKYPLTVEESAALIRAKDRDITEEIFDAARKLKREVYGNRIVIFAPLYIGDHCSKDCHLREFSRNLHFTTKKILTNDELISEVKTLELDGHKRLLLVFEEHSNYTAETISKIVKNVYETKTGKHGEIRRVNINSGPMSVEEFKMIKDVGIGSYQIFQGSYHHATYESIRPQDTYKGEYLYRLDGLNRAIEAGCDDVGIGAFINLYDWRFEALGLVAHALFLQKQFGIGPHTISFPRLQSNPVTKTPTNYLVTDHDFKRLVAILRLSIPYSGMILTSGENVDIRYELLGFGVSQIEAKPCISSRASATELVPAESKQEQVNSGDACSINTVIHELIETGYIPSFCTSCYRLGRTGKLFMEYASPGFVDKFCTPNALLTLKEYLLDYASHDTKHAGELLIEKELSKIKDDKIRNLIAERFKEMEDLGKRDMSL